MEGDRVLGQVRHVDAEHVALAKAALGESRGDRPHRLRQLSVAERAAARAIDQSRPVTPLVSMSEDKIAE